MPFNLSLAPTLARAAISWQGDLTKITAADGTVTSYSLDSFATYGVIPDDWMENATITGLTIGQGITSIGESAFDGCAALVGDLVIPSSVTAIGNSAFEGNLTATGTLTLNEGLLTIGDAAFDHASFTGDPRQAAGQHQFRHRSSHDTKFCNLDRRRGI